MNLKTALLLFLLLPALILSGQSIIHIPFIQPAPFTAGPVENLVEISGNNALTIGGQLIVSGGKDPRTYLWSKDGIVIGNDTVLEIHSPGNYHLLISDSGGCSQNIVFIVSFPAGLGEMDKNSFHIFPNPVHHEIHLYSDYLPEVKSIKLFDQLGKSVRIWTGESVNVGHETLLNVQDIAPGAYLLSFETVNYQIIKSILIQQGKSSN